MYTYTATIGRGTGEFKLTDAQWAGFEDEVQELLADYVLTEDGDVIEVHRGEGVWNGANEESTKVTLLSVEGLSQAYKLEIRAQLARIARRFEQDAIAFTVGESELIAASYTAH